VGRGGSVKPLWFLSGTTGVMGPASPVRSSSVDVDGLEVADLSPWFNPFLLYFVQEARRCGGEVRVLREAGAIEGLVVSDPVERVASVFSRSRSIAESIVRGRGPFGVYSDFLFEPRGEAFDIFATPPGAEPPPYGFHHAIRPIAMDDLPAVLELMREVYGGVNERWFEGLEATPEAGFIAEAGGRPVGAGWVSVVRNHARLHSLAVRATHRRMGLGTDLLFARLLWARRAGSIDVLSEISERNVASRSIAVRAGMRRVGEIYFYPPA
jgi:[ribosomal protein S18]-alanine N-acetyltransferase